MIYNEHTITSLTEMPYDDLTVEEMVKDANVRNGMIEFANTICHNVALLDNGVVKATKELKDLEEFLHTVLWYNYQLKEFVKV